MRELFFSLVLGSLVVSCSSPGGRPLPEMAAEINATLAPVDYVITPGDTVTVTAPSNNQWDHTRVVQPDGKASFLGVGEIAIAGLTPQQLEDRLNDTMSTIISGIEVSVSLETLGERFVTVLGQVLRPGVFPISGARGEHTTILDALAFAGGPFRGRAHLGSVVFIRWDAEQQKQVAWTIDAREKYWASEDPILLQNYDLIFVPQATIDKVNVWVDKYIRQLLPFPQFIIPAQ